jgi:NADH dehydrogenase FAD-containing subunit
MSDEGKIKIYLKSGVKSIEKNTLVLKYEDKEVQLPNDGIIVCAGGTLPTPFLKSIGVMVETKFGTE